MSSTFARTFRRSGLLALAVSASCSIIAANHYTVGFSVYGFEAYTVGDTVRLGAFENYETLDDHRVVTSTSSPEAFTWTTSAPDQAEVSAPGVFVMKAVGSPTIGVRTSHGKFQIPVAIVPPGSTIRVMPRDTTVGVGTKFTMRIVVLDAQGAAVPVTRRASEVYFSLRGNGDGPPNANPNLVQELNTYSFTAKRPGTVGMVANYSLYKRHNLTDSTAVTAK